MIAIQTLATASTKDSVLLVTLPPAQYSARVSGCGTAIIEVYEVPRVEMPRPKLDRFSNAPPDDGVTA